MKPGPFNYFAPTTLSEAVKLLSEHAPEARVLAGGQSLVPMMNFRLARPGVLIDLNRLTGLSDIRDDGDFLAIGAMIREREVENSDLVRTACPLVHDATLNIAHLPIRSRGTIGGSIANADPAAEYPATMLALDATLMAHSVRGERRIAAADFFCGVLTTTLEVDEILTEIRVPKAPSNSGAAFVEISRRHGDFALTGVGAQVTLAGNSIAEVRLAACGVGAGPVRLTEAETILRGCGLSDDILSQAAQAASAQVDPDGDTHATAAYRRKLAGVMTKRAVQKSADRARSSG
ncbi:MAG: Caffeine dehydrogenase subunit beta [Alphaproteobacteria bacterium MarineAlpha11_Bin1]|nr:MAG: Caffeine dehydrogenase subunit beta [Alphaproteobacteria bacterium MarineAlpha11_Bin1]|tara:strand:- start:1729 stop:2601 length:873 start_codon:yes stop_codon:yes gene_type:complete